MTEIRCVLCVLSVPKEPNVNDSSDGQAIFVVNGQSVCGSHINTVYVHTDGGLGSVLARANWKSRDV